MELPSARGEGGVQHAFYPHTADHYRAALTGIRPIATPVGWGDAITETGLGREGHPVLPVDPGGCSGLEAVYRPGSNAKKSTSQAAGTMHVKMQRCLFLEVLEIWRLIFKANKD